jgi:hypothetical protein
LQLKHKTLKYNSNTTINEEVISYFESLGYKTERDRCGGVNYHEILDQEGKCIMQVDWYIPIEAIKQDVIKERDGVGEGR